MRSRRRGFIAAAIAAALVMIPLASPSQADGSTDAYNQIVSGQIAGQTLPILPNGAPKYHNFGWGRQYVGPNGLEFRFTSNGSANFIKFELGVLGLYAGPAVAGATSTSAAALIGATDAATLRTVVANATTVGSLVFADQIDQAIHQLVLNHQCLGMTVPTGTGISTMLTRANAVMSGNLWSVITGSQPSVSVWLEPCSNSFPAPADILVPISFPGVANVVAAQPMAGNGVNNAMYDGRNYLRSSDTPTLQAGHYIKSPNGQYVFMLQTDGNLVLYGPGYVPIWASGTSGYPVDHLTMQSDGNLVLYGLGGYAMWWNSSFGGASHLTIQDDGNAVIYTDPGASVTWQTRTGGHASPSPRGGNLLGGGQQMDLNQYLQSPDGRITLLLQTDGNLVLYGPGYHVLWHAGAGGKGVTRAVMQTDGNFVLYRANNTWVWQTGSGGIGANRVVVQSDGNLVVYRPNNTWVWQAGTGGRI